MAVRFFGQYLVERGVITREAVMDAILLQEKVNLKFGETALSMSLVTKEQMERVHLAQRSYDLKFGDIAVMLGFLTREQVEQVITMQKNNHLFFGEALVQVGALPAAELPRLLDEFKADQAAYQTAAIEVPEDVPNAELCRVYADLSEKLFSRVVGVTCRLGACRVDSAPAGAVVAAMDIVGDVDATCLFAASDNIRRAVASAILAQPNVDWEPEEVLDDAVQEFLNIVCGNVVAKAAQDGMKLDIMPPVIYHPGAESIRVPAGSRAVVFPLHLPDGEQVEIAIFI